MKELGFSRWSSTSHHDSQRWWKQSLKVDNFISSNTCVFTPEFFHFKFPSFQLKLDRFLIKHSFKFYFNRANLGLFTFSSLGIVFFTDFALFIYIDDFLPVPLLVFVLTLSASSQSIRLIMPIDWSHGGRSWTRLDSRHSIKTSRQQRR